MQSTRHFQLLEESKLSGTHFEIVYGKRFLDAPERRLLVLDSSFNPPHFGHCELIERAVEHYKSEQLHVLLLLSVNNADKAAKPATFDKRLYMMSILAELLSKSIDSSVGLTTHARFIEKTGAIRKHGFHVGPITYLMGFDTLIRFFDPRYYQPSTLIEALSEFMQHTELFCLTREDGAGPENQATYCATLATGGFEPHMPRNWASHIFIDSRAGKYYGLSSTKVRNLIAQPRALSDLVPKEILDYICIAGGPKIFTE
ncbi:AFR721Wp [Eremothecium gossypii ATCC 10895]|uniref:AFR721Wp n=1 Tax=Eremothecium gossypii (strain ATCC 10895 / CBS 109.51 / FGSC 9923 / NRRL Y-1056) TaxID=284811 RepID=Q751V4_EREGS|nr:AFR721Wp [Eremothecium gossypii ATCC 10895]AAS54093.1 AFR721Wp [Eremothecium gossypii ATCC 10895]AEY98408.1 FAFR721Wp [Eremothecium gossypii FDAG1]